MNKEVYKEMCSKIYEGESWDRMINCLERKDKEIERLKKQSNDYAKRIIKAIEIYEECCKTQDFSTCDLEMYEILKGVHENGEN